MGINRGKQFEARFREDWKRCFPGSFLYRIPDQMTGYKGYAANPCDFIGYKKPTMYMMEVKSHYGNTFPLANLTQYDKLIGYADIDGVAPGVIIWFIDHDKVIWVPIKEIKRMKEDGKKSVNIKMLNDDTYHIVDLPSRKKRVMLETDYYKIVEEANANGETLQVNA